MEAEAEDTETVPDKALEAETEEGSKTEEGAVIDIEMSIGSSLG